MATPGKSNAAAGGEIAIVTVAERIPGFWRDQPRLWFTQFESIVAPQKSSEENKYHLVVSKLAKEEVLQISDLLSSPPESNKFAALKDRLISIYEESEQKRFQKLLSEMELGDEKPSQLLHRIKDLGRGKLNDDTIRLMWLRQLPASVTTVLAVTDELTIEKLSQVADRVYESTSSRSSSRQQSEVCAVSSITEQLASMQLELAALRAEQAKLHASARHSNNVRVNRDRSRSRSRSRSRPYFQQRHGLCFYHGRFGDRAYRCQAPCSYDSSSQGEPKVQGN